MDGAGGGACLFPFPASKEEDVGGERLELFEGLNVDEVDDEGVGLIFFDDFFAADESLPFLVFAE